MTLTDERKAELWDWWRGVAVGGNMNATQEEMEYLHSRERGTTSVAGFATPRQASIEDGTMRKTVLGRHTDDPPRQSPPPEGPGRCWNGVAWEFESSDVVLFERVIIVGSLGAMTDTGKDVVMAEVFADGERERFLESWTSWKARMSS